MGGRRGENHVQPLEKCLLGMRGDWSVPTGTGSALAWSKLPVPVPGEVGEGWERGSCGCPVPTDHPLQPQTGAGEG